MHGSSIISLHQQLAYRHLLICYSVLVRCSSASLPTFKYTLYSHSPLSEWPVHRVDWGVFRKGTNDRTSIDMNIHQCIIAYVHRECTGIWECINKMIVDLRGPNRIILCNENDPNPPQCTPLDHAFVLDNKAANVVINCKTIIVWNS